MNTKKKKGTTKKTTIKKKTNIKVQCNKNILATKKKKIKQRKIRYGRIFLWIILPIVLLYIVFSCIQFNIKNIFISGNTILSDQEIIELVGIEDYPSIFSSSSFKMEKRLEENMYISKAEVKKKKLREVYIKIEENVPIFYYMYENKTVFSNKESYDGEYSKIKLINYVPKEYYEKLLNGMISINKDVLSRISEIEYTPDEVNDERFLYTMNDGNYVYITLGKISTMDSYIDIVKTFNGKKGILYLDSGEYFEIKEN